jgi:hypothetical protein
MRQKSYSYDSSGKTTTKANSEATIKLNILEKTLATDESFDTYV